MKTTSSLILSSILISLTTTASAPSQSLPLVWNRSADWVAKKNPSPDSKGNLVWHCHHRRGFATLAATWDATWNGWVYGFSRWVGSAPITQNVLYHRTLSSAPFGITPRSGSGTPRTSPSCCRSRANLASPGPRT